MEPNANPWKLAGILTGVCVAVLLGGTGVIAMAMKPERVAAPTSFGSFSANDRSFRCEYPQGWKTKRFEAGGVLSQAKFTKGGAWILVEADLAGSLIAEGMRTPDTGTGGMEGGEGGGSFTPPAIPGVDLGGATDKRPQIDKLHDFLKDKAEGTLADGGYTGEYTEQAAQKFTCALGEGRISEFSVEGGMFMGKGKGYRATVLASERSVTVNCCVPAGDFAAVGPAFKRVIASLSPVQ